MKKLLVFVFFAIALVQCRKDIITFEPYGSQVDEIYALLGQAVEPNNVTEFALTAPISEGYLDSKYNSRIHFFDIDQLFSDAQGQPVTVSTCPDFKLRITEAMTNSQMIAHGLTSKSNDFGVANASGAVSLVAYCNGKELQLRPGAVITIDVPFKPYRHDTGLMLYSAVLDANGKQKDWFEYASQELFLSQGQVDSGFQFNIHKMGWNIGLKTTSSNTQTIRLGLDKKYNEENTFAYLILPNEKANIRMPFDRVADQFSLDGVPMAISDAQIMIVSKIGDTWQSTLKTFNTNDSVIQVQPEVKSDQEIVQNGERSLIVKGTNHEFFL